MGLFGKKKPAAPKGPAMMDDTHLAPGTRAQALGNDTANPVFKVNYDAANAMGGETEGYFKPNADMAPSSSAVAASRLAQKLGLDGLIPETKYATHNVIGADGQRSQVDGAVSKAAKGDALTDNVFDTYLPGYKGGPSDTTKVKGGKGFKFTGSEVNDVDLSRSNTQQQLNQLQWFDALIGNEDRHGGNILVDPESGNVTGIDNDLSFGGSNIGASREWFESGRDDKFLGLPQNIDKATAKKLLKLKPKDLAAVLDPQDGSGPGLSQEEIKAAQARLEAIQAKVKEHKKAGKVVKQWDASTYDAAINEDVSGRTWGTNQKQKYGNYAQRQHGYLEEARDTNVDDLWLKGQREATAPGSRRWKVGERAEGPARMEIGAARANAPKPGADSAPAKVGASNGATTDSKAAPLQRTLSNRVKDTPWADQLKRKKQPV